MAAFAISTSAVSCREAMGIIDQSPCRTRRSRPPIGAEIADHRTLEGVRHAGASNPGWADAHSTLLAPPLLLGNAIGCTQGAGASKAGVAAPHLLGLNWASPE